VAAQVNPTLRPARRW